MKMPNRVQHGKQSLLAAWGASVPTRHEGVTSDDMTTSSCHPTFCTTGEELGMLLNWVGNESEHTSQSLIQRPSFQSNSKSRRQICNRCCMLKLIIFSDYPSFSSL